MAQIRKARASANSKTAKFVVIRTPEGISTLKSGKLLDLVTSYNCETDSAEFIAAWDALCVEQLGHRCDLLGVSYAVTYAD